jgi:APA family basic amino acid/polyamine antiporter
MTLADAAMLAIGSMIGSGIFIVSAGISRAVGSPAALLGVWAATGVITVLGALAFGELCTMFPRAGGQYVFLREAFGPLPGFLYGWALFFVIQTGTIAAVAVAFGRFLGVLFPAVGPERFSHLPGADVCLAVLGCRGPAAAIEIGLSPQRVAALAVVWVLTWSNCRGVRVGARIQTPVTAAKIAALVLLIFLGLTMGRNAAAVDANFSAGTFWAHPLTVEPYLLTVGAAMVGALFSMDAWNNVTFAAAEIQDPSRNLPLALLLGTGAVTVLYVLTNVAYLSVLPLSGVAQGATTVARGIQYAAEDRVATAVAQQMFGAVGAAATAVVVLVSTFGCSNGMLLAGARVYFAMAQDGLFFRLARRLNDRYVPAAALLVQAVWISVLCLTGTYTQLIQYVIFPALGFYAATTVGLFVLRRREPALPRPYRAWGYPVLPALYIALTSAVAVALLVDHTTRGQALVGLVLVAVGVPVYFMWRRSSR